MEFQSRAVRSLVELHEREMRRWLDTWERFAASGAPMPEARGDLDYADRDRLAAHVATAARKFLIWIGGWVGRPVADVDAAAEPRAIAARLRPFVEDVLAGYGRHLASLADEELSPLRRTEWGIDLPIEAVLEHAIVHPMRHRIQLERVLSP